MRLLFFFISVIFLLLTPASCAQNDTRLQDLTPDILRRILLSIPLRDRVKFYASATNTNYISETNSTTTRQTKSISQFVSQFRLICRNYDYAENLLSSLTHATNFTTLHNLQGSIIHPHLNWFYEYRFGFELQAPLRYYYPRHILHISITDPNSLACFQHVLDHIEWFPHITGIYIHSLWPYTEHRKRSRRSVDRNFKRFIDSLAHTIRTYKYKSLEIRIRRMELATNDFVMLDTMLKRLFETLARKRDLEIETLDVSLEIETLDVSVTRIDVIDTLKVRDDAKSFWSGLLNLLISLTKWNRPLKTLKLAFDTCPVFTPDQRIAFRKVISGTSLLKTVSLNYLGDGIRPHLDSELCTLFMKEAFLSTLVPGEDSVVLQNSALREVTIVDSSLHSYMLTHAIKLVCAPSLDSFDFAFIIFNPDMAQDLRSCLFQRAYNDSGLFLPVRELQFFLSGHQPTLRLLRMGVITESAGPESIRLLVHGIRKVIESIVDVSIRFSDFFNYLQWFGIPILLGSMEMSHQLSFILSNGKTMLNMKTLVLQYLDTQMARPVPEPMFDVIESQFANLLNTLTSIAETTAHEQNGLKLESLMLTDFPLSITSGNRWYEFCKHSLASSNLVNVHFMDAIQDAISYPVTSGLILSPQFVHPGVAITQEAMRWFFEGMRVLKSLEYFHCAEGAFPLFLPLEMIEMVWGKKEGGLEGGIKWKMINSWENYGQIDAYVKGVTEPGG